MSLLTKVRGLWRFDGDEEPVAVSRRSFLFMGGVVAAGAVVPAVFGAPDIEASLATFWRSAGNHKTAMGYMLEREAAARRLWAMLRASRAEGMLLDGEWVLRPDDLGRLIHEAGHA